MDWQNDKVFCEIYPFVLKIEGGYEDNPSDRGGPTKFGIAQNFNQAELKKLGVADIRNLTRDQAIQIYFEKYWLNANCQKIPDKVLTLYHFDAAINDGVGEALKLLSRLPKVPYCYSPPPSNLQLWEELREVYLCERRHFYDRCVAANPHDEIFYKGWMNRLTKIEKDGDFLK